MEKKEILSYIAHHPSGRVKLAFVDIDGVLRGKYVSAEKFKSIAEHGLGFCNVIFGWDSADVVYDNSEYTGWHSGYPDANAVIDFNSFRKIPWENDQPFFLGEFVDQQQHPLEVCPRQLLKKLIHQANELGFHPVFAQEFEWFNFQETPAQAAHKNYRDLTPLTPGMFGYSVLRTSLKNEYFEDLYSSLTKFGIPIEGMHTETGPGTYEAAISYSHALEAADRAVLFKSAVKEIAYKHQVMATFMAKIHENLPGCGGHIHQSIWDMEQKNNLFYSSDSKYLMSDLMQSYIAGQLYCLPYILPMLAPTINSYKRLVEGAWAPTTLTWGIDNRTVALRALPTGPKSTRLETRVVGADVNPYLAMAACLAAGIYGINNQMKLQHQPITGNGYVHKSDGVLPYTLLDATNKMCSNELAENLFGKEFVKHFAATRMWEWKQHLKSVTDWEYKRYFEII